MPPSDDSPRKTASLTTSAYLNSFKSIVPHVRSTGLRTAQLRFNAFPEQHSDVAAEFLLNSRYRRHDKEFDLSVQSYYDDACLTMVSKLDQRCGDGRMALGLPDPLPLPMALHEAIAARRSQRAPNGEALSLDALATILQCGGGVTARASVALKDGSACDMPLRTNPSGGALYPVDLYVAAQRVKGLDPGLYRFMNGDNALAPVTGGDAAAVTRLLHAIPSGTYDVAAVSAALALVLRPWRSKRKYGPRGLRFGLMEVGYIAQNVHLASTALGASSCDYGGFYDDEVNQVLSLDGSNEAVVHLIFIGG